MRLPSSIKVKFDHANNPKYPSDAFLRLGMFHAALGEEILGIKNKRTRVYACLCVDASTLLFHPLLTGVASSKKVKQK